MNQKIIRIKKIRIGLFLMVWDQKLDMEFITKKWITLGIHSGIDWKWEDKFVAVPVYLNFGLSPKVGENTIITAQAGYGKGFALGRGNLNGEYRKLRIGIGSDDFTIFIETAQYDITLHNQKSINSINLGISVVNFDL